ncbi:MAG TPA: branched-chain amino acid ABC transporter permease [Roseiarcus sp.]|jgi:branched-chain amino acid transport system permease protein
MDSLAEAAVGRRMGVRGRKGVVRAALVLAVIALGAFAPPAITSSYWLGLLVNAMILGLSAVSIGFLAHHCGLMMFGVSALTGGASYVYAIAIISFGLNGLAAATITLIASTLISALIGAVIVRARPLPFAMLTLALAQLLHSVVLITEVRPWTGGDDGLALNYTGTLFGRTQADMSRPETFWPVCWIAFCGALAIAWSVGRSRFGEILRAVKTNEERMRFSGFDTYAPRVLAFTISGFIAAVAGLLSGFYTAFASPELLDFSAGGNALVATLIGGVETLAGPPLGAMLFVIGQDRFGATGNLELLTGIGVALVIYLFPEGIIGFLQHAADHVVSRFRGQAPGSFSGGGV